MTTPDRPLDLREFQDIVDEARRLIPRYCPEWTDHNVSDPGVTLIEAVASMVDQLIYRLNRVPDLNYVKFLELIGVRLRPPSPARPHPHSPRGLSAPSSPFRAPILDGRACCHA